MNVVTLHQESANHCVAEMMTAAVERSVRGLFVLLVAEVILAVLLIGHASTVNALVSKLYHWYNNVKE